MDEKRFYDLVYEAWTRGKNPDAVSIDRYDDMLAKGYEPEEIQLSDVLPSPKENER